MKIKLTFSSRLYLGDGMKGKKLDSIKNRLLREPSHAKVYVLTIARNPKDQLEFYDARQIVYRYDDIKVIGIARDYRDALKLVERITRECLRDRGDCNLKEYLLC